MLRRLFIEFGWLLLVSVVVVALGLAMHLDELDSENSRSQRIEEGARACRAGVPADVDPYTDSESRGQWLDGWISEREAEMSTESGAGL